VAPRWGLGDVVWVYLAGLIISVVLGTVGYSISGDKVGHPGALTTALAAGGQFGGWFVAIAWVAHHKGRSLRQDFGFQLSVRDGWGLFAGLGLFLAGTIIILPLVNMADESQQVVHDLETATGAKLAVFAIIAGLVAPICEELLFRGLLLRALRRRMDPTAAVAVQALVFALAHPLLSPTIGDLAVVPALLLLGLASGIVATRKGTLGPSIFMHIGFNLVTTVASL
jgi:membrane protease YdiL (CAAX protease family)